MIGKNIIQKLPSPSFILDEEELFRSITGFTEALKEFFSDFTLCYSVKTNALPYLLNLVHSRDCFAEVVSADEYHLARQCGYRESRIIYNGPMKNKKTFLEAVMGGAIVNIETKRELKWLEELSKDNIYKVGLRLNINISRVSMEDADGGQDNSRFGFSDETSDFSDALSVIKKLPNVQLSGIHIHRTVHSRSVRFYKHSIEYACEIIRKYHLELDYMDIGGGFFGIFPEKPTYRDYVCAFREALYGYGLDTLRVIVEPGNALVASCFHYLSEVIDVKHVEKEKWFVTTDGSRNDVDPFFRKQNYLYDLYAEKDSPSVNEQIVSGCTCLENDRLFCIKNGPLLQLGDRILYRNVGAYTMCLSPLFIRFFPCVFAVKKNEIILVRGKWDAEEFLQKSIINN